VIDDGTDEPAEDPFAGSPGEDAERAAQRRRAVVILSAVVAVVLVAAVVAAVAVIEKGGSSTNATVGSSSVPGKSGASLPAAASASVISAITSVPASINQQVGSGESAVAVKPVSGPAMITAGKPTVLFVGGLFCPFCAAERWSIVQALSRFGSFTGLGQARSSEDDIATFDFTAATFASKYVAFTPVESEGQNHEALQRLTNNQRAVFTKYSMGGSFPFLYFNGRFAQAGAGYNPELLLGQDQQQVAAQLSNPNSPVTQSIVGEGNSLTAAICGITNNQPGPVCDTSVISGLESKISGTVNS
jgi:hypothetical protein